MRRYYLSVSIFFLENVHVILTLLDEVIICTATLNLSDEPIPMSCAGCVSGTYVKIFLSVIEPGMIFKIVVIKIKLENGAKQFNTHDMNGEIQTDLKLFNLTLF